MKTMKKDGEVRRVKEQEVTLQTKAGWVLCPKSEYKKLHKSEVVKESTVVKAPKKSKVVKSKGEYVDKRADIQ